MATTTKLTLTFSQDIAALSASDITLTPNSTGTVKGSLSKVGTGVYELLVSGIVASGEVSATVSKDGFNISPTSLSTQVYYVNPLISRNLISLSANGSVSSTTTSLTFTFDNDITGLSTSDISLTPGSTGAIKGSLSKTGTGVYQLALSGISAGGSISATVTKEGYDISNSTKSATVFYVSGIDRMVILPRESASNGVYTDDGITFTSFALPSGFAGGGICYGAGKFVAVGFNTRHAMTSLDGINWTLHSNAMGATARNWSNVAYGNGKYVASSRGQGYTAYSSDGISWTVNSNISSLGAGKYGIAFGNGKFVVSNASASGTFYWSIDGATWTPASTGIPNSGNEVECVLFSFGKFLAFSTDNNKVYTSADGLSWASVTGAACTWSGGIATDSMAVVVSDEPSGNYGHALVSPDGISWTLAAPPIQNDLQTVGHINGRYIIFVWSSNNTMYSTNGSTWQVGNNLPHSLTWWDTATGRVS